MLSDKIDTNVRDLKGALNQVVAMRDLRKQQVTETSVAKMVDTLYPAATV
jgi:chromosomal replication initiation ATPase DnaA